jgi:hypothetical protein
MGYEAIISEDYKGVPRMKYNGDTLDITFTVYTDDMNKFRDYWKNQTVFKLEVGSE